MGCRRAAWAWALIAGCAPEDGWEEPELESIACGTREPIQVSPRATSPYNFFAIGDDWTLASGRQISDTHGVFDAVLFDPCGDGDIEVYEASLVHPVGDGFVQCDGEQASWALTRDAIPVRLTASSHCTDATLTEHGLLVEDQDGILQLFATPEAAPRAIASGLAERWIPDGSQSLWVAIGDRVWYLTNERRLERFDLRSGERSVLGEQIESLAAVPSGDAVVWTRTVDDSDPGVTSVYRLATDDTLVLPGYVDSLWPGIVVVATSTHLKVLDLEAETLDEVRAPIGTGVIRADHGLRSVLVLASFVSGSSPYTIGGLDLDTGEFQPIVGLDHAYSITHDPHGDGLVVADFVDDHPDDDEASKDRMRIVRIARSGSATTLVESATDRWALASDGRLLYEPVLPDTTASGDLHVRNPDGTDRVFARNASLVAPMPWSRPHAFKGSPDLEGDVLVNIASGDTASLWRIPFDTPP